MRPTLGRIQNMQVIFAFEVERLPYAIKSIFITHGNMTIIPVKMHGVIDDAWANWMRSLLVALIVAPDKVWKIMWYFLTVMS